MKDFFDYPEEEADLPEDGNTDIFEDESGIGFTFLKDETYTRDKLYAHYERLSTYLVYKHGKVMYLWSS